MVPIEARRVRFDREEDIEMQDTTGKEKTGKTARKKPGAEDRGQEKPTADDGGVVRSSGRQSELSATINKQQILDRILDSQVAMSLREIMVTSKELRTEIQDLIKVKNVRAVLMGRTEDHPIIANFSKGKGA